MTGTRSTGTRSAARRLLGYEQLHPGQQEAVEALVAGRDAVVVMPTGSGKSAVYELARMSGLRFLYAWPEQLQRPDTIAALAAADPVLVAVDEAHCVSTWGHDFRPDYLRLAPAIELLGHPPVAALTTTASPLARDEIVRALGLRRPVVIVAGFDRPNL